MKKIKYGYALGVLIGSAFWLFVIGYVFYELFNRLINDSGDPFPVLTVIMAFAILVRQASLSEKFKKIQDWINK
jgi:divalent metal cation (Fe/Co/Zn/Cd) transporter